MSLPTFAAADAVCRRAGRHFTQGEHEDFSRHVEHALLTNNALAVEAVAAGEKMYKLIPKHHALSGAVNKPAEQSGGEGSSRNEKERRRG